MSDAPIKILHYCWFGGNPLPEATLEYMKSWRQFLPDFELMLWDESNFDVHSVPFVEQAYKEKKWAFVSDYVRSYALYKYGGLYLDTDVQIIKSLDDLFSSSFAGFEHTDVVAPGLILYADRPELHFYGKAMEMYGSLSFSVEEMHKITSPILFTDLLCDMGLRKDNSLQQVDGITIYPMEYFNPIGEDKYAKPTVTENTRSIHWYDASWYSDELTELFRKRKRFGYFWGTLFFSVMHPIAALKRRRYNKAKNQKT